MQTIILATESSYKIKQFQQLRLPFNTFSPEIDETAKAGESAQQLSVRLAKEKALKTQKYFDDALIVAGDQVIAMPDGCQETLFNKPITRNNAISQLQLCRSKTVCAYTSVCVSKQGSYKLGTVITEVRFRPLSDNEIKNYVDNEYVLNCAGSFKCEALGISLFDSIRSDDPSALIGLPLICLNKLLIEQNVNPLAPSQLSRTP